MDSGLTTKITKSTKIQVRFLFFVTFVAFVVTVPTAAITLVSVEDKIAIGRQANADTRKKIPELQDQGIR